MTQVAVAVNGRFLAQRTTGVQRYAREVVRALDEHLEAGQHARIAARLLVPSDAALDLPLRQIEIRRTGRLRGQAWEQLQLPTGAGADLLVNLGNTAPLARRRQIVTIHDASVWAVPESYSRRFVLWYRLLLPATARRARGVVTVSEFSRRELAGRVGVALDAIRVVAAGHEHMLRVPADRRVFERWGLGQRPFVVAVSSLAPHKNFAVAVQSMALLGNDVECDLVVAGGANPKVFAAGGEAAVRSTSIGYVTDAELRALYERAACLVYPSRYEGFGLPPLEAMACGCPVVVARAASLPEVCGDAALYADPDSPEEFAGAVRRILTETGLHDELRQLGLARARRFTWAGAAVALLGLVREAAGR